jgi:cell wall-associated NlpC family hydrolase
MTARSERSAQRTKGWAVSALTTAAVAATALVPADPALAADLTPGNGPAPAALASPPAPGTADPFGLGFGAPPDQPPAADPAPAPAPNPDGDGPSNAGAADPGTPGDGDNAAGADTTGHGDQADGGPAPAAQAPAPLPAPGTGPAPAPPAAPPAQQPADPADPGDAGTPSATPTPSASPSPDSAQTAKDAKADSVRAAESTALHAAAAEKGAPYRWGAAGPDSFDCSGLVVYSYRKAGRHLPRTAAQQYATTRHIPAGDRRSGDLVFFHSGSNVYHVGVYAGHNRIWHAPYTGTRVRLERIWTPDVWYGRVGG